MMKSERKRPVIYLSGPIMDEHEGVARAWREEAKRLLFAFVMQNEKNPPSLFLIVLFADRPEPTAGGD